jgi:hypothetical protein
LAVKNTSRQRIRAVFIWVEKSYVIVMRRQKSITPCLGSETDKEEFRIY